MANKNAKFIGFLESVKHTNPALIESIKKGFNACFEGFDGIDDEDIDLQEMNDRKISKSSDPEFYKQSIINKVNGGDFSKVNEILNLSRDMQSKYFDRKVLSNIAYMINDNFAYDLAGNEPEVTRAINGLVRNQWLHKKTVYTVV